MDTFAEFATGRDEFSLTWLFARWYKVSIHFLGGYSGGAMSVAPIAARVHSKLKTSRL